MDRKIVYPGQIPLETDLLGTNQNAMVGLGKLAAAILGTAGVVSGLSVGPSTPAALTVVVTAGEIYQLQNLEATAYSSLPADVTHTCMKQGIQLDSTTLACPAPTTAGFSINYLIEASYADADIANTVLPYYNSSNPSQAYSGPGGNGMAQATTRQGKVVIQAKAGIAATSGTQTTPAVDMGFIALAVVTVANGQTTITAGNITASVSTSVLTSSLLDMVNGNSPGRLLGAQVFTANGTYNPTPGTKSVIVEVQGGGGSGAGAGSTPTGTVSCGNGGAGGGYARSRLTSNFTGISVVVGSGGNNSSSNGNAGGASSFGTITATGGGGGGLISVNSFPATLNCPAPGVGSGGNIDNAKGGQGIPLLICNTSNFTSGGGGSSRFGAGAEQVASTATGQSAVSYGAGGGGASVGSGGTAKASGAGGAGIVIIWEYA